LQIGIDGSEEGLIWHYKNEPIKFATNNTEAMRIDSSGRVGIGQASPTSPLHVKSGANNDNSIITIEGATNNIFELGYATAGAFLNSAAGDPLVFRINETEAMRIDSSGNVGIGVTPSAWGTFNALEMSNGVYLGSYTGGTTAGYLGTNNYFNGSNFIYKNSDYASRYQQVDGNHQWYTAPSGTAGNAVSFSEAMRINSSGVVTIGDPNAASYGGGLVVADLTGSYITVADNGSGERLHLEGGSGSTTVGSKSNHNLRIITNDAEVARFDTSGNLLVGKTTSSSSSVGAEFRPDGIGIFGRDSNVAILANRNTSDGDIISIRKDGSTVGSIGVNSGNSYTVFNGTCGISASGGRLCATNENGVLNDGGIDLGKDNLRFKDAYLSGSAYTPVVQGLGDEAGLTFGGSQIAPRKNNAAANGTVDLGAATARFKDFYLSGGVYLGGTGSANKLDDYEEGTWTPTLPHGGTVGTVIKSVYTKVGNLVTVYCSVLLNPTNHALTFFIGGLPFTGVSNNHGGGSISYSGGMDVRHWSAPLVDQYGQVYFHRKDPNTAQILCSAFGGQNRHFIMQATYIRA